MHGQQFWERERERESEGWENDELWGDVKVLKLDTGGKEVEMVLFQETELYKLGPPDSFHYLNQSSCIEIPGRESNADGYLQTKRAMSVVGVSPEEQVNWAHGREAHLIMTPDFGGSTCCVCTRKYKEQD